MPSTRKRIGFLPSILAHDIINDICDHENISQSKLTGILVEEALYARGLFNINNLSSSHNRNKYINRLENYCDTKSSKKDIFSIKEKKNQRDIENNNLIIDKFYSKIEFELLNEFIEFQKFKQMVSERNNSK